MYVILGVLFFLILGGTFIKTMIDKYIIKFLEFCDNTAAKIAAFFNKKKKK
jgi:hypothetical protein